MSRPQPASYYTGRPAAPKIFKDKLPWKHPVLSKRAQQHNCGTRLRPLGRAGCRKKRGGKQGGKTIKAREGGHKER